jgi:hypothetical protein
MHKLSVLIYFLLQVELVILPRSIINENPPEQQQQPPPPPPPPQNQESEEEQNEEEEQEVSYFIECFFFGLLIDYC